MLFPEATLSVLIYGALIVTAIAVVSLVGMLINDWKKDKVW